MTWHSSPSSPWTVQPVRILSIKDEIPQTTTYRLEFVDPTAGITFHFRPGQFNMLYLPGFGESAICISSDPQATHTISHTVRQVGNVTCALARQQVGDQFFVRGPFGSGWPLDAWVGCDLVIACGGLGLAPLRPAIYHIINHRSDYRNVHLLYGARTPHDQLYAEEFEDWAAAGIELETTVDRGDASWQGHIGVVPTLLERLRLEAEQTRVLTCGPAIMMRFIVFEALERGVAPRHIYLSLERNMQCAVGFCGHCQLGPAFVCKDGPVFTYERMEPYFNLDDL